jgi:hypothetical protein
MADFGNSGILPRKTRNVLRTDQSSLSILKKRSGVAASSKTLYKHMK